MNKIFIHSYRFMFLCTEQFRRNQLKTLVVCPFIALAAQNIRYVCTYVNS